MKSAHASRVASRAARRWTPTLLAAAALAAALMSASVSAAPSQDGVWKDTAEFSYVVTAGNSESSTLGFKNTLTRQWERSLFTLRLGGVRAESTTGTPIAIGTVGSFTVVDPPKELSAESYFIRAKYDRKVSDRFFWHAGTGWDRNRFSGIDSRVVLEGGVGNVWYDQDDLKFRTEYAVTFTDQQDVFEVPGTDTTFAGLRFSWDYLNQLTSNTTYTNVLLVDGNLEESSDYRADMTHALSVAMTEKMALKLSLQWLYDNQPSFRSVTLFDADPNQGGTPQGTVAVELDKLDTVFTASLVVNF